MARFFFFTLVAALASVTAYGEAQWFKGATHVHSLWSDGDAAPEHIIQWYKSRGWDFVCNSEHNTLMQGERYEAVQAEGKLTPARVQALSAEFGKDWVELQYNEAGALTMRLKTIDELRAHFEKPGEFVLVPSEEMTTLKGNPHVNALNVREVVPGLPGDGGKTEMVQHYVTRSRRRAESTASP